MVVQDNAPMLSALVAEVEKHTGNEPMLSGAPDLRRMGRMQMAFLTYLREQWQQWREPETGEVSLLSAWRWVDDWTGNINASKRMRDEAKRWTSAGLARLLHSFIRRGLIVVVKHDDGYNFIRARGSHDKASVIRQE